MLSMISTKDVEIRQMSDKNKLSPIEYDLNMYGLQNALKNVTPHLRDVLMNHINKIDLHVQALEKEVEPHGKAAGKT